MLTSPRVALARANFPRTAATWRETNGGVGEAVADSDVQPHYGCGWDGCCCCYCCFYCCDACFLLQNSSKQQNQFNFAVLRHYSAFQNSNHANLQRAKPQAERWQTQEMRSPCVQRSLDQGGPPTCNRNRKSNTKPLTICSLHSDDSE
jgi:hypothetical protein